MLAESTLAAFGKSVLGVMLTGMGNDGMREFIKVHQAGGYNIAQDQATCVVYGMPRAVADAGAADEILPLDKIGRASGPHSGCSRLERDHFIWKRLSDRGPLSFLCIVARFYQENRIHFS